MTDVFYSDLFQNLPPFDSPSGSKAVLDTFRRHVQAKAREAIKHQSVFTLAWGAHALLESPDACLVSDKIVPLFPIEKLACLLVLEVLSSVDSAPPQHDLESPFLPLLVSDSLAVLQESKEDDMEKDCILELVASMLPTIVEGPLFKEITAVVEENKNVPDTVRVDLESTIQKWTYMYREENYVERKMWAVTEAEEKELGRLADQASMISFPKERILSPLPSVDAPFCRPLPPPMLPIYSYEEDEQPLSEEEKNDLMEYAHVELLWLTPTTLRVMLIPDDKATSVKSEEFKETLDLLQKKAFTEPFSPKEERNILDVLRMKDHPNPPSELIEKRLKLFKESGATPQNLPKLVENNPLVAHECLLVVLQTSPESVKNEYLSALVGMDITLHTMEVVNRLATHGMAGLGRREPFLHPEYVNLFITSCIASCENIQDRNSQNRLVRLVCVFIQSLLRNKIVHVQVCCDAMSRSFPSSKWICTLILAVSMKRIFTLRCKHSVLNFRGFGRRPPFLSC
jgi:hypothetical protein